MFKKCFVGFLTVLKQFGIFKSMNGSCGCKNPSIMNCELSVPPIIKSKRYETKSKQNNSTELSGYLLDHYNHKDNPTNANKRNLCWFADVRMQFQCHVFYSSRGFGAGMLSVVGPICLSCSRYLLVSMVYYWFKIAN